jgi:hypothetical protein
MVRDKSLQEISATSKEMMPKHLPKAEMKRIVNTGTSVLNQHSKKLI